MAANDEVVKLAFSSLSAAATAFASGTVSPCLLWWSVSDLHQATCVCSSASLCHRLLDQQQPGIILFQSRPATFSMNAIRFIYTHMPFAIRFAIAHCQCLMRKNFTHTLSYLYLRFVLNLKYRIPHPYSHPVPKSLSFPIYRIANIKVKTEKKNVTHYIP